METVAGVFDSCEIAREAAWDLSGAGFRNVNLLAPGASAEKLQKVPVQESEQPGLGKAIGGVVGAALGVAGGLELGTAAASALIPGVGPVVAVGLAAAALLGTGAGIGGAAVGAAIEEKTTTGLPIDEIYVYKDALRKGRCVVFASVADEEQAARVRSVLAGHGAEAVDPARQDPDVGLIDASREGYEPR